MSHMKTRCLVHFASEKPTKRFIDTQKVTVFHYNKYSLLAKIKLLSVIPWASLYWIYFSLIVKKASSFLNLFLEPTITEQSV